MSCCQGFGGGGALGVTKNIAVQMDVLPLGSGTAELLTRVPSASRVSLVLFSLATYPTFFFFFLRKMCSLENS